MRQGIHLAILFLLLAANMVSAQPTQSTLSGGYIPRPPDEPFRKELNRTRRVKPWPYIREADVLWRKRVWEEIDVKQKMNYPLFYPLQEKKGRKSLWQVINAGLEDPMSGMIAYKAYATVADGGYEDDEFTNPVPITDLGSVLGPKFVIDSVCKSMRIPQNLDTDGDCVLDSVDACKTEPGKADFSDPKKNGCPTKFEPTDIVSYQLKEDWIFDKQRSQRFVRIIGIAPMYLDTTEKVPVRKPMFWLYYKQCRGVFAEAECFNMMNDAFKGTFEDLFETRRFTGFVIKEENIYDRKIQDYAQGIDALLEGDRIKKEIFEYEHDLWNY